MWSEDRVCFKTWLKTWSQISLSLFPFKSGPFHLILTRSLGLLQPLWYSRSNALWLLRLSQKGTYSFHLLLLGFLLLNPSHYAVRKHKVSHGKLMCRYSGQQPQLKSNRHESEQVFRSFHPQSWNHSQPSSLPRWGPRRCKTETNLPPLCTYQISDTQNSWV